MSNLPTDSKARKDMPICRGLLDYFPDACAAVAELSRIGNDQHNPGEPMHWAREKSMDQADCIVRHLIDRGDYDTDGQLHSVKVAWRALALAQLDIEDHALEQALAEQFAPRGHTMEYQQRPKPEGEPYGKMAVPTVAEIVAGPLAFEKRTTRLAPIDNPHGYENLSVWGQTIEEEKATKRRTYAVDNAADEGFGSF